MLLGVAGGVTALLIALMVKGVEIKWENLAGGIGGVIGSSVGIALQNKPNRGGNEGNSDSGVIGNPKNPNGNPSPNNESLEVVLASRRKDENYSDIHRYLN